MKQKKRLANKLASMLGINIMNVRGAGECAVDTLQQIVDFFKYLHTEDTEGKKVIRDLLAKAAREKPTESTDTAEQGAESAEV